VAVQRGPLVLALDSRYGVPVRDASIVLPGDELELQETSTGNGHSPMAAFTAAGRSDGRDVQLTLVDYASAGSLGPGADEFETWIPIA
jgi:hypothetical protein